MTQLNQVAWRFICVGSDSDAVLPYNRWRLHWCPAWLLVKTWATGSCDTGCTHPHRASSLADAWREDLNPCSEKQNRIRAWQVNLAAQEKPSHSLLPLCSYPGISRGCCRATALCPVVGRLVEPNAHFPAPPCWGAGAGHVPSAVGTCPSSAPPHQSTDPCVSAPSTAPAAKHGSMLLMATRNCCFYTVSPPVMSCSLRGPMSFTWPWTHTHIQAHTEFFPWLLPCHSMLHWTFLSPDSHLIVQEKLETGWGRLKQLLMWTGMAEFP